MERGFKYRIYPNACQREQIARTLGSCRFVYNRALDVKKSAYSETGKTVSWTELCCRRGNATPRPPGSRKRTPWRSSSPSATSTAPTRTSSDVCARAGSRASPSSSRAGTPDSRTAPTAARSSTATISRCRSSGLSVLRYPDRSKGVSCRSRSPWTQPAATSPPSSAPTCRPRTHPRPTGRSESTSASRHLRRSRTVARSEIRATSRNTSASLRGNSAGSPAGRVLARARNSRGGT